jgi:hypothetical protein
MLTTRSAVCLRLALSGKFWARFAPAIWNNLRIIFMREKAMRLAHRKLHQLDIYRQILEMARSV